MGDLVLDRIVLAEGGPLSRVGGGEGRGGHVVVIEVNKVGAGASVPPSSLGIPPGTVSGEVSFLPTVEAGASGPRGSVLGILSVRISYFHESSVCGVRSIGSSLVSVCSGAVKVHGDCRVVHVLWGVGRVILGASLIPGGVPVVARGVLLEVLIRLARLVVELSVLEEVVGGLSSPCEGFEYLFRFGYVDSHIPVLLVGGISDGVSCFQDAVEHRAGQSCEELLDTFSVVFVVFSVID